jgi:thiol-disulfide isomerase/thioredoxin
MNFQLLSILSLILFSYHHNLYAQKIKFYDNQLSKAQSRAEKKSKILFVDAYASWCGPCKRMDKEIFTDPEVVKFHKQKFINCKIDLESVVGGIFSEDYPIKSIPTLFYFNAEKKLIFKKIGAPLKAEDMLEYGQTALDINAHLQNKTPINNPKSLFHYSYYLKEEGLDYHPYLNGFLQKQESWSAPDAMQIIFDLASEKDSLAIDFFLDHKTDFAKIYGEDAVYEKQMMLVLDLILEFLDNSNTNPDFEKASSIFIRYFGQEKYLEHLLLFEYRYHQQHRNKAKMRQTLERFVNEVVRKMPEGKEKAIEYIQAAANYYDLSEGMEDLKAKAFEWGERAAAIYQGYEVFSILAILYQDAEIYDQAKFYQEKANQSKDDKK